MQKTKIEWTDFSASLLKYRDAAGQTVHACVKISPGCTHCYAETLSNRWKPGRKYTLPMTRETTPFFDEAEAKRILKSKALAGHRVFVDDMTDLFGDWVPDEIIDRHFHVFEQRSDVTFQVLTKRAERSRQYLSWRWGKRYDGPGSRIPARNVWIGCSVEDQQRADQRIPQLLATPAAVRFLSCEPLLGPVNLCAIAGGPDNEFCRGGFCDRVPGNCRPSQPGIHWVIVGGESGHAARPMHPDWVRSLRDQCQSAAVPFFFKQWGELAPTGVGQASPRARWGLVGPKSEWVEYPKSKEIVVQPAAARMPGAECMAAIGKKASGRMLDGREWSEWPESRNSVVSQQ